MSPSHGSRPSPLRGAVSLDVQRDAGRSGQIGGNAVEVGAEGAKDGFLALGRLGRLFSTPWQGKKKIIFHISHCLLIFFSRTRGGKKKASEPSVNSKSEVFWEFSGGGGKNPCFRRVGSNMPSEPSGNGGKRRSRDSTSRKAMNVPGLWVVMAGGWFRRKAQ